MSIKFPNKNEYPAYAQAYVGHFNENSNLLEELKAGLKSMLDLIGPLSDEQLLFRYEPGKWSIKEMLVHIMDAERVFLIRAFRISRNDRVKQPGFEQDDYVPYSNADDLSKEQILSEYQAIRESTIQFFKNVQDSAMDRWGNANGSEQTARGIAFTLVGHERHHIGVLKERYLSQIL